MVNENLQRFDCDGLELVINTKTGEVFASQSALARMIDKEPDNRAVRNFLKGVSDSDVIKAEIQTAGGLQGVSLYDV